MKFIGSNGSANLITAIRKRFGNKSMKFLERELNNINWIYAGSINWIKVYLIATFQTVMTFWSKTNNHPTNIRLLASRKLNLNEEYSFWINLPRRRLPCGKNYEPQWELRTLKVSAKRKVILLKIWIKKYLCWIAIILKLHFVRVRQILINFW